MIQMTLFQDKTIKERTLDLLRSGWYSTNQIVQAIGAQSADRRLRNLRAEGWVIEERKRPDGIIERHAI